MHALYDYLSGNVPGGIGLYLLLVLLFWLTLYSISKNNDLFTRPRFRKTFLMIWLVLSGGYLLIWLNDPPAAKIKRYSVLVESSTPDREWLAAWLRDALSVVVKPSQGKSRVHFLQRWSYPLETSAADRERITDSLLTQLAVAPVVRARVVSGQNQLNLQVSRYDDASDNNPQTREFSLDAASPQKVLPDLLKWLEEPFEFRRHRPAIPLADSSLALAKEAFYHGDYTRSRALCLQILPHYPEQPEIRKWYNYNEVKLAASEKESQEATRQNKLDLAVRPWQARLNKARVVLAAMVQDNLKNDVEDELLIAIASESFMLDEYYGDAEEFLEIGYGVNPLSLDILTRLSQLHFTRYRDLGFATETEILQRILDIAPFHETTLERYADRLLPRVNLEQATGEQLRFQLLLALRLNPNSGRTWVLLGKYDNAIKNYDEAIVAFTKADSLRPDNGVLKYNMGVALYRLERFSEAEQYFKDAIRLDDYLDAHLYMGAILKDRGDYRNALEYFRYRVAHKGGQDDIYVIEAMKGIRECLHELKIPIPGEDG